MTRLVLAVPLLVALALTGCSGPTVSADCRNALKAMSDAPDDVAADEWNNLVAGGTTDCATVKEFLAGVHENPAAVWDSSSPLDESTVVHTVCLLDPTTPMCVDAQAQG